MKTICIFIFISLTASMLLIGCGEAEQPVNDTVIIPSDTVVTASGVSWLDIGTQKFEISIQNEDVGYMQLDINNHRADSLLITQTINWKMMLMGEQRDIEMSMTAVSDREYNLGSMEMQMSDGSATITVKAWRQDSLLISEIGTAGRVIENSTVIEGDYLPILADLACASMEWTEGQERTFQSFDPASGMILSSTAVCEGFEEVELLGDTVNAARLIFSQMGTRNTIWVFEGQIVMEFEEGLGMQMLRIPSDLENDVQDEPEYSDGNYLVSNSDVWYASEIRQVFPEGIELLNWNYPLDELPCLPLDISTFSFESNRNLDFGDEFPAFEIVGSLTIDAIPAPFVVYDGAMGEKYLLNFNAFLISPQGEIVWSQDGFPRQEDAWVSSEGSTCEFQLIGAYDGPIDNHRVLVIVSGDPIHSPVSWETRVILGVGEKEL